MIPAAWSSRPEIGLKRTATLRSPYTVEPSAMAGNSARPIWQRAFGLLGASASPRTTHSPANTCDPPGGLPVASWSKLQDAAGAPGAGDAYVTAGVPAQLARMSARATGLTRRSRRSTRWSIKERKDYRRMKLVGSGACREAWL